MTFHVGDKVRALPNSYYSITNNGWIGYVIQVISQSRIRVSANKNGRDDVYEVRANCFELVETTIDGIRTKMYKPIEEEAEIIRLIFSMYSKPQTSFGDVMRYLEEHGIRKRDGKLFNRSRLRDVVINPAYVEADYQLYDFFKSQGTNIVNTPQDFIGINGAYLYSGDSFKRKTISLVGHTLVLAPHEGLVDSATWVKCRSKCLNNQSVARPIKAKATWLAGKIKCANCGYARFTFITKSG